MRLDKYLKVSRIIKRRTVANEACDAGRVLVNGQPAKASRDIKPGDKLEIQFGQRTVKIEVLNVADTVKKEAVAECIKAYRQIADFNEVVAVSALRSVNTDTLLDTVFRYLPYGPMYYDEDTVTDQPMRQIAAEMIREKALRRLQEEIPHGIAVTIEQMKERPDGSVMDIEASIICERESHKGIIIGKGGSMLKAIGSDARRDIEDMLEMKVNLKLFVKVRKDWRDSDLYMKNFGYHEDEK